MGKPRIDNPLFVKTETKHPSQDSAQEAPPQSSEVQISNTSEVKNLRTLEVDNLKTSELKNSTTSELPKFRTLEPLTVRLRKDQIETLEKLSRQIMQKRGKGSKKERITKNTIVRACLDALAKLNIDLKDISSEEKLLEKILSITMTKGGGHGT